MTEKEKDNAELSADANTGTGNIPTVAVPAQWDDDLLGSIPSIHRLKFIRIKIILAKIGYPKDVIESLMSDLTEEAKIDIPLGRTQMFYDESGRIWVVTRVSPRDLTSIDIAENSEEEIVKLTQFDFNSFDLKYEHFVNAILGPLSHLMLTIFKNAKIKKIMSEELSGDKGKSIESSLRFIENLIKNNPNPNNTQ